MASMPTLSLCLDSCSIRFCGCSRLCVLVCVDSYINDSLLAFVFTFRIHVLVFLRSRFVCAVVSFSLLRTFFIYVSARVSFALAFRSRCYARDSFTFLPAFRLRWRFVIIYSRVCIWLFFFLL